MRHHCANMAKQIEVLRGVKTRGACVLTVVPFSPTCWLRLLSSMGTKWRVTFSQHSSFFSCCNENCRFCHKLFLWFWLLLQSCNVDWCNKALDEEGAISSCRETPTQLPFQLQVRYTDLDGAKAMRVSTQVQQVTTNRTEAEARVYSVHIVFVSSIFENSHSTCWLLAKEFWKSVKVWQN